MSILNLPNIFKRSGRKISPVVLVSLDGWGLAPPSSGNAISLAKTSSMDSFYANYPHGELIASGESVGLPAGEVGNSEVGHLTMGVGRVIYQSLKRINISIENGSFYGNAAFTKAAEHVSHNSSKMHLIGLVGSGNVHSSLEHLYTLLQFLKKSGTKNVYLHLFTDGRDAPPKEGASIMAAIQQKLELMELGSIATVSGRYYAMDRDARWERIQKTYEALVLGRGKTATTAEVAVNQSYNEGKTDEFVEPTIIPERGKAITIDDNDACIFFNFRVDRARELTMALTLPDFEHTNVEHFGFQISDLKSKGQIDPNKTFSREKIAKNLFFVSMTEYHSEFPVSGIAFPPQYNFPDSITEVLSKNNIPNLHIAESEKERMVTYYFRGMNPNAFPSEDIIIVPSSKVETYDKKPEMSARHILKRFKREISKDKYGFAVLNFANPDMVAHSGNIKETIRAIEVVDKVLGELVNFVLVRDGVILISADHGNAEELLAFPSQSFYYTTDKGVKNTDHSSNPVPIIIIKNELKGKGNMHLTGTLADIAPTILAMMKLAIPSTMTGRSLLLPNANDTT